MRKANSVALSFVGKLSLGVIGLALMLTFAPTGNANEPVNEPVSEPAAVKPATLKAPTVKSVPLKSIQKISQRIDELVEDQLKKNGEKLNSRTTDEVFLRRAYLDIAGRIPTIDETRDFLRSSKKTKREDLIDRLLDSYGYVSRQYNYWADLLRVKTRMSGNLSGVGYIDYVKDSLEQNKPYDQFVNDLITSEGPNLERGNGAVGYYMRDRNMPEDNMSNTIRIFLGTRLECAQCHDHPFDKWTQRQYFEMVAFTGGIRYRASDVGSANEVRKMYRNADLPAKVKPIFNRMTQTLSYGISGSGTGLARLPEGFLGEDGYEGEIVVGKTMFQSKKLVDAKIPKINPKKKKKAKGNAQQGVIPGARPINSREVYANWLTDPQNPRFAKVISNRLWKQALGVGLVEPVDIIEDNTVASNPELLEFLTATMIDLNFDMKQFLRAIYNSDVYQAAAYEKDVLDATKFNFSGPIVRRMAAEQIWDSLLVLTVPNTDVRSEPIAVGRYGMEGSEYDRYEKMKSMSAEQLKDLALKIADGMGKKRKRVNTKDTPEYKKMQSTRQKLGKQIQAAKKAKNQAKVRELMIEQAKVLSKYRLKTSNAFLRASELTSPAPASHFLREFGQSDREQIDGSNTDPAVTQVLAMMNGYVEQKITKDTSSILMQTALKATSGKECVELIYLSMLNRKPTSKEAREWKKDFDEAVRQKDNAKVKEVYADLIWTLANSNEFIFVK
jgi:hypothetical protein